MKHFSAFICNLSQFISPSTFHCWGKPAAEGIFCVRRNLLRGVISLSNCRVHCQGGRGRGRGACTSRSRCDYRPGAKKNVVRSHRLGSFGRCAVITLVPESWAAGDSIRLYFHPVYMKEGGKQKEIVFSGHGIGLGPEPCAVWGMTLKTEHFYRCGVNLRFFHRVVSEVR